LDETIDDVTALYESVVAAGGARVSDLFGLAFDLEAPYAQEFIAARAKQLAGQITDTTYEAIQDAMRAGVAEGEGIPAIADRIRHVFSVATESRATTIARTEVISAFNGSATLTANEYGDDVVAGQEWIATNDGRTRTEHAERDGEIVGIGETFSGGLAYPGDPSGDAADTINCRCTVAFLTPEEMNGRSGGRSKLIDRRVAIAAFSAWDGRDRKQVRQAWKVAA
jgi:SPP1 gp7 family putative phage head morphogenesis protein